MAASPLLQIALEGLTGLHGCQWKEVCRGQGTEGVELKIPTLQSALMESVTIQSDVWHGLKISGLQSKHYVQAGDKILRPRRQRNHQLVKWLTAHGWRIDLTAMDHLFATVHSESHYFTIEWSKATGAFTVRDSLASCTKAAHKEATVLLWAILLASSRVDNTLWLHEPVLVLSEHQVLGEFRELLLHRPGHQGWHPPITEEEQENLWRMGIKVRKDTEGVVGGWTWSRDANFPQQSNGVDCGMVAIVSTMFLARGWQIPSMHEAKINRYRRWLFKTIIDDSEDLFEIPCSRCGTTQHGKQRCVAKCANKSNCDYAREHLHDMMICDELPREPRGTMSNKRPAGTTQLKFDKTQKSKGRRGANTPPLQVQQVAAKDEMIVDPLSHITGGKVPSSAIGAQTRGQRISTGQERAQQVLWQHGILPGTKRNGAWHA
jgi:hypothetical protein